MYRPQAFALRISHILVSLLVLVLSKTVLVFEKPLPTEYEYRHHPHSVLIKMLSSRTLGVFAMSVHTYEWILAPFSPVVRGEGLGMRGRECRKRNDISDIARVSPLAPRPPLPETGRGGERFLISRHVLVFRHFYQILQAKIWVRELNPTDSLKVCK